MPSDLVAVRACTESSGKVASQADSSNSGVAALGLVEATPRLIYQDPWL